jgi:hypothetical protein
MSAPNKNPAPRGDRPHPEMSVDKLLTHTKRQVGCTTDRLDLTTVNHTLGHHVGPLACGQLHGSI